MRTPPRELIVISFAVALTLLGDSLLYAVLPAIWHKIGLELWMVGALLSANRFIRFLTNPLAGRLVERFGLRKPFLTAVFVAAITTATYGISSGFVVFLIARCFWGACWSVLRLGGFLSALGLSTSKNQGYHLGFFTGFTRIGTLAAVLVGSFLVDYIGFSSTVWIFGFLIMVGGIVLLKEPIHDVLPPKPVPLKQPPHEDNSTFLTDRRRWMIYAISCMNGMTGSQLVVATLGLWLFQNFGENIDLFNMTIGVASLSGLLLSGRYLIEVLWSPGAGHLADRFSHIKFILIAMPLLCATMIFFSFQTHLFPGVLAAGVIFLTGTALRVALDATMGEITPPEHRSRVMSWYVNWSDLGNALGPFLAFQLVTSTGLDLVYRGAAILLAGTGLPMLFILRSTSNKMMLGKKME
jgi:MFS family permease